MDKTITEKPVTLQEYQRQLDEAAQAVRRLAGSAPRPLAIVGGSGMAHMVSTMTVEKRIPFESVVHLPRPSVAGHSPTLFVGQTANCPAIFFAGRVHLYEGLDPKSVVFYVHLARRLGATVLLLTNAAGGLSPHLQPADLMMITDHVNVTFRDPLKGCCRLQFPAVRKANSPYDPSLCRMLREAARLEKINLKEGTYVGTLGPAYETKAEAAWLREIGGDAVGMSTVAEVAAARQVGMSVAAVSCIANKVSFWGAHQAVTHDEVVRSVGAAVERLGRLISRWAGMIANDPNH